MTSSIIKNRVGVWVCVCLRKKSIQGERRASHGETVMESENWTLTWIPLSSHGRGWLSEGSGGGRCVCVCMGGGSVSYQPNVTFRRKEKKNPKCYLLFIYKNWKTWIHFYFLHILTTDIKTKRHKGAHEEVCVGAWGTQLFFFYNQLPLVKTVINGFAFVFFIYILTLAIYH